MNPLLLFLAATLRISVPYTFAAVGASLSERGGVINIGDELIGDGYDPARAQSSVERIADTLRLVFDRARRDGVAPNRAAEQMARERIKAARQTAVAR